MGADEVPHTVVDGAGQAGDGAGDGAEGEAFACRDQGSLGNGDLRLCTTERIRHLLVGAGADDVLSQEVTAIALIELGSGEGCLGCREAGGSLRDGCAIRDIIELEEGLTSLHALTFGDENLGDEARHLRADLGIILATDDGGISVVGGEVPCAERAYGEFLWTLVLSLLGRLARAGGEKGEPYGEEQEA